jgi:hemerythrin
MILKDIVWGKVLSIEVDEIDEDHKKLQQRILEADKTMTDEDTSLLERWLTEHILTEDMRLGSYLSQVI